MKRSYLSYLFLLFLCSFLNARIFYVSPGGNDSTGNGSNLAPWRRIQYAIDNAAPGDSIFIIGDDQVASDDYIENIKISKNLFIQGILSQKTRPQIRAQDTFALPVIHVHSCGPIIKNLDVYGSSSAGFFLENAKFCQLENNRSGWDQFHHNGQGILLSGSHYNFIEKNIIRYSGSWAIQFERSHQNTIYGNHVSDAVLHAITLRNSDGNLIADNHLVNNQDYGIMFIPGCEHNVIKNNKIAKNNAGIVFFDDSDQNYIYSNDIRQNLRGIALYRGSTENYIFLNKIAENAEQIISSNCQNQFFSPSLIPYSYQQKSYANFLGNYYKHLNAVDNDNNGISDDPLLIAVAACSTFDTFALSDSFINNEADFSLTVRKSRRGYNLVCPQLAKADYSKYQIFADTEPLSQLLLDSVSSLGATQKVLARLSKGRDYYIRVQALDSLNNKSHFSDPIMFRVPGQVFEPYVLVAQDHRGGFSQGCAWADLDLDGFDDLIVADNYNVDPIQIWMNDHGVLHQNLTTIFSDHPIECENVSAGDYNNDGWVDVLVADYRNSGWIYTNNGKMDFERSPIMPTADKSNSASASWLDLNNDGYLDIYRPSIDAQHTLYLNDQNRKFVHAEHSAIIFQQPFRSYDTWADMDNDGDQDLFFSISSPNINRFYRNEGRLAFSEILDSNACGLPIPSVGASWGDLNNDGYLDLFVASSGGFRPNYLLMNDQKGGFLHMADGDIAKTRDDSHACCLADFDNDADLDIFYVNQGQRNCLFWNLGDAKFLRETKGALVNQAARGRGTCAADVNNDGFVDIFVSNSGQKNVLYYNNGNENNWLKVKLIGTLSNRSAIGATIRLQINKQGKSIWQMRHVASQTSSRGQNSFTQHFGCSRAQFVDSLRVEWPSGIVQTLNHIQVNQLLTIVEENNFGCDAEGFTVRIIEDSTDQSEHLGKALRYGLKNAKINVNPKAEETDYLLKIQSQDIGNLIDYHFDIICRKNGSRKQFSGLIKKSNLSDNGQRLAQDIKNRIQGAHE